MQAANDYEVKAGLQQIEEFTVAGISVVTDNQKATGDINALWERFFKEQIGQQIEDTKESDIIYAVYSDYQGDHTKPYRLTIGYKIKDTLNPPNGFDHIKVESGDYAMMGAAGEQPKALIETWEAIWSSDLGRKFKTDFEAYGPRFFEEGVNEVLVCVGVEV